MRPESLVAPRRGRRRLRIAALAAVALGVAAWAAAARWPAPPATPYRTAVATVTDVVVRVDAPGTLDVPGRVTLFAPVGGIVERVHVEEGARVRAAEVLATIAADEVATDAARAGAASRAAVARRDDAVTTLASAEEALERGRRLRAAGLASDVEVATLDAAARRARAAVDAAAAELDAARATARGARARVTDRAVRAPFDGIVLRRDVVPGVAVAPGGPAMFVVVPALDPLELTASIDEADVAALGAVVSASFSVPAYPGRRFEATLRRVRMAPTRTGPAISYDAILDVPNPDGALRPGMSASVELVVARRDRVLAVPDAALRWAPAGVPADRRRVYRLEDGRPRAVAVEPGLTDGVTTEVAGELAPGDVVIVGARGGGR